MGEKTEDSQPLRKLRLVVTTKKPFLVNRKPIGLLGITQDYAVQLPFFLKNIQHSWDFSSLTTGIFYQNYKTGRIWCDEKFMELFPGGKFSRMRNVLNDDRKEVFNILSLE